MNGPNAFLFALFGAFMEVLPAAFPSWFPPSGADGSSARVLWLDLMGGVQIGLGGLYGVRMLLAALASRAFAASAADRDETLVLPTPRGISAH